MVLKALNSMMDGDVLFWVDTGCQIDPLKGTKFKHYLNCLEEKPVLCFEIKYQEAHWSKRITVERVLGEKSTQLLKQYPRQFCSGIFGLRKTEETVQLVKDWLSIMMEGGKKYSNDDVDDISRENSGFKENRHDQSVFSLLCKRENHLVNVCSDNITDEYHKENTIFQPVRMRK